VKLKVVHETTYRYGDPVTTSHHEARISPRESDHQRTIAHHIEIEPAPSIRRARFDYFGNRAHYFSFGEPHRALSVKATSVVELRPPHQPDVTKTPPWESVRDRLRQDSRRDVLDAYQMTLESAFVKASHDLAAYGAPSFTPGRPVLDAVRELTRRIHTEFTYDPRATDISTPVAQVLVERRGVCQDFAHLMLGCLRAHGIAARYVSGYLMTRPPPGQPRRVGADASHAWVSAWVPEEGWFDFDPTNDVMPAEEHVTVACGRDFADVTPIRGVILGGGAHTLQVSVDVAPVEEPAKAGAPSP
jgi:transglutaminase-like putative cysteine protease